MDTAAMLRALAEPMRFAIFQSLLERKHCVRSLSRKLGVTEPAISQHLRVMREAGLIYGEKYGRHTHYMPLQSAMDALAEEFARMARRSAELDRDMTSCQCEYREEKET